MTAGLDALSRGFRVGSLTTANRIVMAPMTRRRSPGGLPTADVAAYYASRARARVGLIITEGIFVPHASAGFGLDVPRLDGPESRRAWSVVTEAVHAAGGRIAAQLWHVGVTRPEGSGPSPAAPTLAPSGIALDGTPYGRSASAADIDAIVSAFAQAAAHAVAAGFDALEVHGAHGYLIDQFLWERTNRRDDAYGRGARTELAVEVVRAIRSEVPDGFPVIFRFSQWKSGAYDQKLAHSPRQLEAVLLPLVDAGVDVLHASTRRFWLPEFEGSALNLAGWAKAITGLPSITVGSVGLDTEFNGPAGWSCRAGRTDLDELLARLRSEEFDLVAVGRALIADREWAAKTLDGATADIEPYAVEQLETLA